MTRGVFEAVGDAWVPTEAAVSPWGTDRLHGGPVLGLLAHAACAAVNDPVYELTRFTGDLFARVDNAPLHTTSTVVRKGRRMALCDVTLHCNDRDVARASALFCVPGDGSHAHLDTSHPEGPDSLPVHPLISERRASKMPHGFHSEVLTRFGAAQGHGRTIWFHMPMPLVVGQAPDPVIAAVALSDFNNAVSSIAAYEEGRKSAHMNTDTTLYFERPPTGDWFAMTSDMQSDRAGISVGQVVHHDRDGRFGRSLQARLETAF